MAASQFLRRSILVDAATRFYEFCVCFCLC
jgi:hypothetical protein